jgi:hypothetical protein
VSVSHGVATCLNVGRFGSWPSFWT